MSVSFGLSLTCFRVLRNTQHCKKSISQNYKLIHQYRNTIPWKNTAELSEELIKSVIYYDNGLLVLNKPYGVTFSRDGGSTKAEVSSTIAPEDVVFKKLDKSATQKRSSTYLSSGVVSDDLNLVDCLPYLKKHFNLNKLHIARVPEKYISGVAILTTSKDLVDEINKTRAHLPTGKDKYQAVVVGVPRFTHGITKLAFKLAEHSQKGKRPILLQKWSNKSFKRKEVRIGTFHYQMKSKGYDNLASLVEICVDLRKYHAYRMFCSDFLLSPVLGDNLFGSRVQTVMGVPMLVDPFGDNANSPQKLSHELYELLGLTSTQANVIPLHVHLSEMLLPRFLKGKPLSFKAPQPVHFQWACEKLGLKPLEEISKLATIC